MFKRLLPAAILLIGIVSCKSKVALNYNNNFVDAERSLGADIETTETNIGNYSTMQQFDSVVIAATRMEKLVDAKLTDLKDKPAPDPKEGEDFKQAGIRYFSYIKGVYTTYKDYGNAKTPEEREAQLDKIKEMVAKKPDVISAIQGAQKKFADANGFKIENK